VGSLAGAPGALAQTPPPPEQPPPEQPPTTGPLPPDLVLSGRDVRLNRAGYAHTKIACRSRGSAPDDACLGTLTLRLAETLTVMVPSKGGGKPHQRTVHQGPIGRAPFRLQVGDVALLTFHLTPLQQRAVRQAGEVSVQLIGGWVSRSGQGDVSKRFTTLYFPKQPPQV
jgi:hypothetical protein